MTLFRPRPLLCGCCSSPPLSRANMYQPIFAIPQPQRAPMLWEYCRPLVNVLRDECRRRCVCGARGATMSRRGIGRRAHTTRTLSSTPLNGSDPPGPVFRNPPKTRTLHFGGEGSGRFPPPLRESRGGGGSQPPPPCQHTLGVQKCAGPNWGLLRNVGKPQVFSGFPFILEVAVQFLCVVPWI